MQPVKLQQFEGPLDLLLELIEERKLEISEISLAEVTDQYLIHIEKMKLAGSLDQIAEFLDIAARLLLIKSRALLPEVPVEQAEEIDDLKERLARYRRYREAARHFEELLASPYRSFRPAGERETNIKGFLPPEDIDLGGLLQAFQKALAEIPRDEVTTVTRIVLPKITVEEKVIQIRAKLSASRSLRFEALIRDVKNRFEAIITFLALLELIKIRFAHVRQDELFGDIFIEVEK